MQVYSYTAKDNKGTLHKAEVEAASLGEATKLLRSKQLFPLEITVRKPGLFGPDILERFTKISSKDKVIFTRQLATLVKAGLPLARALKVLTEQIDNPKMLRIARSVSNEIEGGVPLSKALAGFPDVFSNIYISMIESGEATGNLDEVLLRLAQQEEKTDTTNRKIRGAFTYPVVVIVVLILVTVLMITLVLPQVGKMYLDLNKPLPFFTSVLLSISAAMIKFWYIIVLLIGGAIYGARLYLFSAKGRESVDRLKLNAPVVKNLISKLYMARFARTLGSLIESGVPVLQALGIVSRVTNNIHLEKSINQITTKVKAGLPLSQPISESPLFLPLVGQMMAVGEQTGTIGDSLNKVADYYEDEVDQAVKSISTLIEPAAMMVLGVMVAFLIVSVLLPIYGLVSAVR